MLDNDAWFVWAAQIINFLILVALLRKFLYGRVLNAIASRQQEISARVAEAAQSQQEAEQLAANCREREQELEAAREKLISEARQEIETWKREALEEARAEVDAAQAQWWDALQRDRDRFLMELRERAGRQVHQVARHVLSELSSAQLEQQLVAAFLDRLKSLDQATRDRMIAGRSKGGHATITSALPLPAAQQAEIQKGLHADFGDSQRVQFEMNADLICGVELRMGDQRLSWNIADTIESLEHNFAAALNHKHAGSVSS